MSLVSEATPGCAEAREMRIDKDTSRNFMMVSFSRESDYKTGTSYCQHVESSTYNIEQRRTLSCVEFRNLVTIQHPKKYVNKSVILNEVKDLLFRQKQILRYRSE